MSAVQPLLGASSDSPPPGGYGKLVTPPCYAQHVPCCWPTGAPSPEIPGQPVGEVPQNEVSPEPSEPPQPSAPPITIMDQIEGYANVGFDKGGSSIPDIPPPLSQAAAPETQHEPPSPE